MTAPNRCSLCGLRIAPGESSARHNYNMGRMEPRERDALRAAHPDFRTWAIVPEDWPPREDATALAVDPIDLYRPAPVAVTPRPTRSAPCPRCVWLGQAERAAITGREPPPEVIDPCTCTGGES